MCVRSNLPDDPHLSTQDALPKSLSRRVLRLDFFFFAFIIRLIRQIVSHFFTFFFFLSSHVFLFIRAFHVFYCGPFCCFLFDRFLKGGTSRRDKKAAITSTRFYPTWTLFSTCCDGILCRPLTRSFVGLMPVRRANIESSFLFVSPRGNRVSGMVVRKRQINIKRITIRKHTRVASGCWTDSISRDKYVRRKQCTLFSPVGLFIGAANSG